MNLVYNSETATKILSSHSVKEAHTKVPYVSLILLDEIKFSKKLKQ